MALGAARAPTPVHPHALTHALTRAPTHVQPRLYPR